jgi:hypothetical protein
MFVAFEEVLQIYSQVFETIIIFFQFKGYVFVISDVFLDIFSNSFKLLS